MFQAPSGRGPVAHDGRRRPGRGAEWPRATRPSFPRGQPRARAHRSPPPCPPCGQRAAGGPPDAPCSASDRAKRPRFGDTPPATRFTGAASDDSVNATRVGPEGKTRARCLFPSRTGGTTGGGPQRRQRPRLGAPVSPMGGPCSSATGPGLCQRSRVGATPPRAGGPRSSSTMRPGCHRQPRLGALQPLAEGPRSTSTTRPGGSRLLRTRALLAIADDPRSTSTIRPGSGGLSPTSRKRARPSGQERSLSLPLGTAMSTPGPPSAPTTTKRTKLALSTGRYSRPYDYG